VGGSEKIEDWLSKTQCIYSIRDSKAQSRGWGSLVGAVIVLDAMADAAAGKTIDSATRETDNAYRLDGYRLDD